MNKFRVALFVLLALGVASSAFAADFKSQQRVRISDGTDDFGVTSAIPLFTQLSDGTDVATVNGSGQLDVAVGNTVTVSATDLDIRDLTQASDSVAVGDGTDTLAVNADGSINITDNSGSLTVDATNLDIRDLTSASDSVEVLQATHDNLNANANLQVGDADVSVSNPVPTSPGYSTITGEVQDYDTASAVASDATSNHDYTVTGSTTLLLKSVTVAASGAMKAEIQTGPVASLVTKAVIFTSGSHLTETIVFDPPIEVPDTSTGTVRVIRRNDDNQAMDVYSTIIGVEV